MQKYRCAYRRKADRSATTANARLGQTKVEQLCATLRQHDVAGFEIPMDDAGPVSFIERRRDLHCVAERLIDRQRPFARCVASVSPSRNSITRKSIPSWLPMSCSVQM